MEILISLGELPDNGELRLDAVMLQGRRAHSEIDHAGVIYQMNGAIPQVAQQTRNTLEPLTKWKEKDPASIIWIARPNAG